MGGVPILVEGLGLAVGGAAADEPLVQLLFLGGYLAFEYEVRQLFLGMRLDRRCAEHVEYVVVYFAQQ